MRLRKFIGATIIWPRANKILHVVLIEIHVPGGVSALLETRCLVNTVSTPGGV